MEKLPEINSLNQHFSIFSLVLQNRVIIHICLKLTFNFIICQVFSLFRVETLI